jgi:hypothetical protein
MVRARVRRLPEPSLSLFSRIRRGGRHVSTPISLDRVRLTEERPHVMHTRVLLGVAGLAGVTIALGQFVDAGSDSPAGVLAPGGDEVQFAGVIGPDVIVGDIQGTRHWATDDVETAYSIGTTSCNVGDQTLDWDGGDGPHPVISQNLFRLNNGRFEHIGQAWLKHSFCALQQGLCDDCQNGGGCLNILYPLCSDPYTATRNGGQNGLGPKWQVDAHTGVFPWPWAGGEGTGGDYRRRLRAKNADLDMGGEFFVEGMYVAEDDALWANQNNNASYRRVTIGSQGQDYPMNLSGTTQRTKPAIQAWQDNDPDVVLVPIQIDEDGEKDQNGRYDDGRFIIGYKVTDNQNGTWTYEYAVYNQNSHRSGRVWSVPVPAGATLTDIGFHDVDYHSGDGIDGSNYDGTDWPDSRDGDSIDWSTDTWAENSNANAIRWATIYNFRFTADVAPGDSTATLGIYRPGTPDSMAVAIVGPVSADECVPAADGDVNFDGCTDFADILDVLSNWGEPGGAPAGDADCDNDVDFDDLLIVLSGWDAKGECK